MESVECEFSMFFSANQNTNFSRYLASSCSVAIVGYILLLSSSVPAAQYIGTFLAASGV
jgi:hypothetical protein